MSGAQHTRRAVRILVPAIGAAMACYIIAISLNPDSYFHYKFRERSPWFHPTAGVALLVGATALETAALFWVIGTTRLGRIWLRGILILAILLPWGFVLAQGVIHSPGFYIAHLVWVWGLIAAISTGALLSGVAHAYTLLRPRRG